jgi:hypothetical protein
VFKIKVSEICTKSLIKAYVVHFVKKNLYFLIFFALRSKVVTFFMWDFSCFCTF